MPSPTTTRVDEAFRQVEEDLQRGAREIYERLRKAATTMETEVPALLRAGERERASSRYELSREAAMRRDGLVRARRVVATECPSYGVNRLTKMLDGPPPSVEPKPDRNSLPSLARPI